MRPAHLGLLPRREELDTVASDLRAEILHAQDGLHRRLVGDLVPKEHHGEHGKPAVDPLGAVGAALDVVRALRAQPMPVFMACLAGACERERARVADGVRVQAEAAQPVGAACEAQSGVKRSGVKPDPV